MDINDQRDVSEEAANRNIEFEENLPDILGEIRERLQSAVKNNCLGSVHLDELRKVTESYRTGQLTEKQAIRMIGEISTIYEEVRQ